VTVASWFLYLGVCTEQKERHRVTLKGTVPAAQWSGENHENVGSIAILAITRITNNYFMNLELCF
jgi:hypothetical protein